MQNKYSATDESTVEGGVRKVDVVHCLKRGWIGQSAVRHRYLLLVQIDRCGWICPLRRERDRESYEDGVLFLITVCSYLCTKWSETFFLLNPRVGELEGQP